MTTPAEKHLQKTLAQQTVDTGPVDAHKENAIELLKSQLHQQKKELSAKQSITAKKELKAKLIANIWEDYLAAKLKDKTGFDDNVLSTLFVWLIDICQFNKAIEVAKYMITHDIPVPFNFKRDIYSVLAEQIADAYNSDPDSVSLSQLQEVDSLTNDADMVDEIRAKLNKALAFANYPDDLEKSLKHAEYAYKLNQKSGVKGLITKLKKEIANQKENPKYKKNVGDSQNSPARAGAAVE